jgi:protein arginine kinase activator
VCELKLSDFRAKSWLGCASCYAAFEQEIDAVLVQVHGAREHKGKQYKGCEKVLPRDAGVDINELRKKLDVAVRNEEFELAAELRDRINRITGRGIAAAGKSEILSAKS